MNDVLMAIALRKQREHEAREVAIRALHAFGDAIANCAIAEMVAENAAAEMRGRCCRAAWAVAEVLERTHPREAIGARLAHEAVVDAAHGPRVRLHQKLDSLAPGDEREDVAPMPARVVAWVREWIDTAPVEELQQWRMGWSTGEPGVRFERCNADRDDSVTITERSFAYHLYSREDLDDSEAEGVWCEVAFDPPHELIEWIPSREDGA